MGIRDPKPDRTVHGVTADGREIVRYDRAGKWYAETPGGTRLRYRLSEAVYALAEPDATWYERKPGGGRLDAKVRYLRSIGYGRALDQ